MRQYLDLKREVGDAMLFFRMGDFYEVFFDDARQAGELLGIAVTSRQNDAEGKAIPMAGVPYHAAEGYIARLVRAGVRVAVCEQVEPSGLSKGPVRREIVRVATPSTYLDPAYLAGSEAAYLMVVAESGTRNSPRLGRRGSIFPPGTSPPPSSPEAAGSAVAPKPWPAFVPANC